MQSKRILIIISVYFAMLIVFSAGKTFWFDDICQINMVNVNSLSELFVNIRAQDNNPPLSHLISYMWLKIAPYGTYWLKFPNILFVCLGIYFTALIAMTYYGEKAGIICALAGSSLWVIVERAAYTFRPYGLYYFASALVLYLFFRKNDAVEKDKRNKILYGISLILLLYSHYFGILIFGILFVEDIVVCIKRKAHTLSIIFQYFVPGLLFIPWICFASLSSFNKLSGFWPNKPGFLELFGTAPLLLDFDIVIIVFVLYEVVMILGKIFRRKADLIGTTLVFEPMLLFLGVFIFSHISGGSVWVSRYFIGIVPALLVLFSAGFTDAVNYMRKKYRIGDASFVKILYTAFVIYCVINTIWSLSRNYKKAVNPYELCVDFLKQQSDIYDEGVMVYDEGIDNPRGWNYYVSEKHTKQSFNVYSSIDVIDFSAISKIYRVNPSHPEMVLENGGIYSEYECIYKDDILPIYVYVKR